MRKLSLPTGLNLKGYWLILLSLLALNGPAFSQSPCPPVIGTITSNPGFPGCKAPGGAPFKVLLVLDESASINFGSGFEDEVEMAVTGFASTLAGGVTGPGKMQMGIIEFSDASAPVMSLTDVKAAGFQTAVSNYLNGENISRTPNYEPNGGTNFEAALNQAKAFPHVDMIFFITDGNPTVGAGINVWRGLANDIKCSGTYIFGIGIGTGISVSNIQALSGLDELGGSTTLLNGADFVRETFTTLPASLIDLANSLIDTRPPVITCNSNIRVNNEPGQCGKNVSFTTTVSDNCPNVNLSCTGASGGFFPVGLTTVTCTATDNVGNTARCSFTITVLDLEAPVVTCPATRTISCEESLDPSNTGTPLASDNCGIGGIGNTDVRVNGPCPNEFTVNRTWDVADVNGNAVSCLQVIKVEDHKSPVISCPPNITVTCDTTVAKTGMATATDNCDASVSITRRDLHLSGDCDWFCITERSFTAADDCSNTSKCIQTITKNTAPVIEGALPITLGFSNSTVTVPAGKAECILKWLPYSGTLPSGLKFDNAVVGADCLPGNNPVNALGQLENALLGEAVKLKLFVKLKPALGTSKLSSFTTCTLEPIIRQALAPNPDVNELLRVTDLSLGNIAVIVTNPQHAKFLLDLLKCINGTRTVCNP